MLGPQRQHDRVVVGGGLELEVEGGAEALAQGQPEAAVDPPSERRVGDQLHAARLVEEALEHHVVGRGQHAEDGAPGGEVLDQLGRRLGVDPAHLDEVGMGAGLVPRRQPFVHQPA